MRRLLSAGLPSLTPKRTLELAKAHKLCDGVEGKNEAQREAKLRLELETEYAVLAEAEHALSQYVES